MLITHTRKATSKFYHTSQINDLINFNGKSILQFVSTENGEKLFGNEKNDSFQRENSIVRLNKPSEAMATANCMFGEPSQVNQQFCPILVGQHEPRWLNFIIAFSFHVNNISDPSSFHSPITVPIMSTPQSGRTPSTRDREPAIKIRELD